MVYIPYSKKQVSIAINITLNIVSKLNIYNMVIRYYNSYNLTNKCKSMIFIIIFQQSCIITLIYTFKHIKFFRQYINVDTDGFLQC